MNVTDPPARGMTAQEDMLRAAFRAGEAYAYWCADHWDGPQPEDEDAAVARIAAESAADQ